MNRRYLVIGGCMIIGVYATLFNSNIATAENLHWSMTLDSEEVNCFDQIYVASHWSGSHWKTQMLADAEVAPAYLNGNGLKDYVYLVEGEGWCGSAGCKLLIGEMERNGVCRLLYDDDGFDHISVLQRRDYGYHRLYTPCEVRFDGKQYLQLHPECPTVDIQR